MMRTLPKKLLSTLIIASCLSAAPVMAQSAQEKGFAIAAKSDRSDRGFGDSVADLKMVLYAPNGKNSTRDLSMKILEIPDEQVGDKSIIAFNSPADIKGTLFLSHAHIIDADDQWLYLSKVKKIKRIASKNKSGPFVSSEFAYEDFTAQELNKFTYKFLREEPCPNALNMKCDVVERYPTYEKSGYSRQIAWTDQTDYQVRKIDFYDRKDDLRKTLDFSKYQKFEGKYWRPMLMVMTNHVNGKKTDLSYSNYKFSQGLDDNDFEKGVLTRAH